MIISNELKQLANQFEEDIKNSHDWSKIPRDQFPYTVEFDALYFMIWRILPEGKKPSGRQFTENDLWRMVVYLHKTGRIKTEKKQSQFDKDAESGGFDF
jgi:hypothetical protein